MRTDIRYNARRFIHPYILPAISVSFLRANQSTLHVPDVYDSTDTKSAFSRCVNKVEQNSVWGEKMVETLMSSPLVSGVCDAFTRDGQHLVQSLFAGTRDSIRIETLDVLETSDVIRECTHLYDESSSGDAVVNAWIEEPAKGDIIVTIHIRHLERKLASALLAAIIQAVNAAHPKDPTKDVVQTPPTRFVFSDDCP